VVTALSPSGTGDASDAGPTVLLAAAAGERHALGLYMAAEVLEAGGFRVVNLGSDVPVEGLAQTIALQRPAVSR